MENMNIAILGFGREGKSTLKFLKSSPSYKNAEISILDKKTDKNYLKKLGNFDIVFRTPGIPYNLPEIQNAIKKGVKFSSATALFFDEVEKMVRRDSLQTKIIGITGTKGKGTTATLLYKILKTCGEKAFLAGNIGTSPLDLLPKIRINQPRLHKSASPIIILELSSFQLQDLRKSPNIAVVLNIFPDHMDSHKNFNEYINAKANIAKFQKKSGKVFYDATNKYSKDIALKSKGKKIPVDWKKFQYTSKMPGEHNAKNAAMAIAIALSLGCPKEKIENVIKNFKGNEHRLEFVRAIRINPCKQNATNPCKSVSVNFYNDSASTNPQTTIAAINAFKEPKVLIAGGKDKGLNYAPLAKTLKNSNTKLVILFGENKNKIKRQIAKSEIKIVFAKNLPAAVNLAYKKASSSKLRASGFIIIFSPAAASFDMFKDYADRGKKFKALVKKLRQK